MRERVHIAAGMAAALALAPWLRGRAAAFWLGASLTDADLYAYYVLRHRRLDPRAAVRYYNTLTGRREHARKVLHHPLAPLLALAAGRRAPAVAAFGAGVSLHLLLDAAGDVRYRRLRHALERRSGGHCEHCGRPQLSITSMEPHHWPDWPETARGGSEDHGRRGRREDQADLAAWRLLCRPCSEARHRAEGTL